MEWIEIFEHELHGGGTQFIPTPCQHCQNAPCVNVCPVGAAFASPEGAILIDQERCIGCRLCMAACPYDRRFFNWGNAPVPQEAKSIDYDIERQIGAKRGTVVKCDLCPDMARAGKLPFCIQGCPTNAIYYGDLEEDFASNGEEVVKVSQFLSNNSAYRLKEDLGTKPRVYYVHGNGEAVGRNPYHKGRKPTVWHWQDKIEGSTTWQRSGR
jgi:molybdopterin-containing oxidoreductase family iron-sulfur binding subunit